MTPTHISIALTALTTIGGLTAVYTDSVARDREHTVRIEQGRNDVARLEQDVRALKGDIRADLAELKVEMRQLRDSVNQRR
jgi:hypothetical protein